MTQYCHGEPGRFPDDEFAKDKSGKLSFPLIHMTAVPHFASGALRFPGGDPGVANVLAQINLHMLSKSKVELEAVLSKLNEESK